MRAFSADNLVSSVLFDKHFICYILNQLEDSSPQTIRKQCTFEVLRLGHPLAAFLVDLKCALFSYRKQIPSSSWYKYNFLSTDAILAVIIAGPAWLILALLVTVILPKFPAIVLGLVLGVMLLILPMANHIEILIAIRRHNNQLADAVSGQNLSVI